MKLITALPKWWDTTLSSCCNAYLETSLTNKSCGNAVSAHTLELRCTLLSLIQGRMESFLFSISASRQPYSQHDAQYAVYTVYGLLYACTRIYCVWTAICVYMYIPTCTLNRALIQVINFTPNALHFPSLFKRLTSASFLPPPFLMFSPISNYSLASSSSPLLPISHFICFTVTTTE